MEIDACREALLDDLPCQRLRLVVVGNGGEDDDDVSWMDRICRKGKENLQFYFV